MNIIKEEILNTILVLFPILIYFIYNCYRELKSDKYNKLLFNLSLFISMHLCIKYGYSTKGINILLFANIPILIAYLKEENFIAIILSIFVLINIKDNNIIILLIEYICFYLLYLKNKARKLKPNQYITIISIIESFFISIQIITTYGYNYLTLVEILLSILLFYIITYILLYLFKLANNISNLYVTAKEFEKEKQLKNSLFKITHEVKNPIAVCKGYLEMINIDNKDKANKYLNIIKQEIDRSLNIMSDFMEFSKIKVDKELLDINILLEDITEELKILLKNKNIKLNTIITKDEIYIEGDYNRLKQVFINIVKNSIESIKNKGEINIITHILKKNYYIEITDNGCGMDEQTLKKVKELFYTTKKNGTGLGVSLSEEIIKAHNGSMEYKSKKDKGTKVIVKLPITMI